MFCNSAEAVGGSCEHQPTWDNKALFSRCYLQFIQQLHKLTALLYLPWALPDYLLSMLTS